MVVIAFLVIALIFAFRAAVAQWFASPTFLSLLPGPAVIAFLVAALLAYVLGAP